MRILQLRKWLSASDDNGGKVRATGLARALSRFADVDAVGFADAGSAGLHDSSRLAHYRRLYPVPLPHPAVRAARVAAEVGRGRSLRSARFCSPAYRGRVQAALTTGAYDAVQVEELSMLANLDPLPLALPVIYSAHNFESALTLQLLRARGGALAALAPFDRRRATAEERRALRIARFCLAVSDADKRDLASLGPPRCCPIHVVPNCAGDDIVAGRVSVSAGERPRRVVFIACFSWYPNAEAARWFLGVVLPHLRRMGPPCAVHFVGSGIAPPLAATIHAAGCTSASDVADTGPYLERARVAISPLLSGGGTRLKIVEAWAAGVPVVSTPLGATGLSGANGSDFLLAREPAAFAAGVSRLLSDDSLYQRLRDHGLRQAATMRWARQAPVLEALYATLR